MNIYSIPKNEKNESISYLIAFSRGSITKEAVAEFRHHIHKVINGELWSQRLNQYGEPFKSFGEFMEADLPEGAECNFEFIEQLCKSSPSFMVKIRDAWVAKPGAPLGNKNAIGGEAVSTKSNNVTNCTKSVDDGEKNISPKRGNSKSYTLSRLKKQVPELFEKVCNGELSANQAAIQAGFRKPVFQCEDDPQAVLRAFVERYGVEVLIDCLKRMTDENG